MNNISINTDDFDEPILFNGGEILPRIKQQFIDSISLDSNVDIDLRYHTQSSDDLIGLVSLVDAIRRIGVVRNTIVNFNLFIPYFLGARQDRVANVGECLSIKVYADIINSLQAKTVEICDPHSDVTPALINNCHLYPIENIIDKVIDSCQPDFIISPDAGATKRIYTYLGKISCQIPVIQCLKKRDTKTGKLSGFNIITQGNIGIIDLRKKKCLILDDICDGGGTFLGLADEFQKLGEGQLSELYLYVTHGIFSQGYDKLLEKYKTIYTTDSFIPDQLYCDNGRVVVYELN